MIRSRLKTAHLAANELLSEYFVPKYSFSAAKLRFCDSSSLKISIFRIKQPLLNNFLEIEAKKQLQI